jgi:hypothetical protein
MFLESWDRELSKYARIFEKLLTVAENGPSQCLAWVASSRITIEDIFCKIIVFGRIIY